MNLEFSKHLLLEIAPEDRDVVLKKLKAGIPVYRAYMVCLDVSGPHCLEIVSTTEVFKKIYRHKQYFVIGLAAEKKQAFQMVERLFQAYFTGKPIFTREEFFSYCQRGESLS